MHIKAERPGDADIIHSMTVSAFATVPYGDGSEGRVIDALRAAGALTLSLIVEDEGAIIGHIAFSPVTINGQHGPWFGLGPVSVRPDRQFTGIGSALIREGLQQMSALGAELCVLLGNPSYYRRFGFEHDPALTCDDGPAEAFQRLVIKGEAPTGLVAFHPAFTVG
jgi:putative acetyltransferase